jgi:sucrose-6-phosphate hydrolase SacC (GH32 family)
MTITAEKRSALRPALHFTAEKMWINDPNGLIHHNGQYHLFYQANPYGTTWGNMSWGHATSPDLHNWTEHPVAIACDDEEEIYSGSIVFDDTNSSGLGDRDAKPLVAIYTSAYKLSSKRSGTQAQSLAYSLDGGTTWEKYGNNPVLTRHSAHFRDPKVFRYTGTDETYWVMVAVEAEQREVVIYKSEDLKHWEHLSNFGPANATGGVWECPDLFPLPVDGDPQHMKWVLTVNLNPGGPNGGSAGQYFIGHFDGVTFTSETTVADDSTDPRPQLQRYDWLDWGRDYYAAVSFNDAPDKRRIMIAWMNNWDYAEAVPTAPWRGQMSLPRELSLATKNGRPHLIQRPAVSHLISASEPSAAKEGPILLDNSEYQLRAGLQGAGIIDIDMRIQDAGEVGLLIQGPDSEIRIGVRPAEGTLFLDRSAAGNTSFHSTFPSIDSAPAPTKDGRLQMRVYLDHNSIELFIHDGEITLTDAIFPSSPLTSLTFYALDGRATVDSCITTDSTWGASGTNGA